MNTFESHTEATKKNTAQEIAGSSHIENPEVPNNQPLDEERVHTQASQLKADEIQARENDLEKIKALELLTGLDLEESEGEIDDALEKEKDKQKEKEIGQLKEKFLAHIQSSEYLQKLIIEFNGDEYKAKETQQEREENIRSVTFEVLPKSVLRDRQKQKYIRHIMKEEDSPVERQQKMDAINDHLSQILILGSYEKEEHKIFVADDEEGYLDLTWHELTHASTRLKQSFSEKTVQLLKDIFRSTNDKSDSYFSSNEEMLARKQQLDRDLAILGIKKYGETTTDEHVEKILESYKAGVLSLGSMQLLERIDTDNLKKMLDEVAKNEEQDSERTG